MLKMIEIELELISDIDMHLFIEKEWGEVFLTFLKDIVKQIINTWNLMMLIKQIDVSHILTEITYLDEQWVDILLMVD